MGPFSLRACGSTCVIVFVSLQSRQIHLVKDGQRTKNETHFLRQVQETSTPQGLATNPPCQRWSTYQKRDALSAASARNINPTRSRSTRSPRNASLLRDVGVTTGNRLDMVVRPSPSSERRLRP